MSFHAQDITEYSNMTLQQQVQQHLTNTGISLRELSRRSGVSHTTIGKILRGGTYKSDTAHALYSLISITPISTYKTLDATVEQLAAQCIDSDLTHVRDDALECGKQRRIAALEAEVSVWRKKENQACEQAREMAHNLQDVLEKREQHLKSCENALIEAKQQTQSVLDESGKQLADLSLQLHSANAEIKRLTALSETHGQNWKAACVRSEQLQKQFDRCQSEFASMVQTMGSFHTTEMIGVSVQIADHLSTIKGLRTAIKNTATHYDQQVMRLRGYVWSLIAALVFVVASGLVVWGGV